MEAGKQLIDGLFAPNRLLEIPFYQRSYVWKKEQWERFKDDMEYVTQTKKPYFLGSIILKQKDTPSYATSARVTDARVVIDGQQRLTTIMLFLKALSLKTDNNDYFMRDFCLINNAPQLAHGKADCEAFEKVIALKPGETLPALDQQSNIIDAFNYFFQTIDPDKLDEVAIRQNVNLICIDIAREGEDEQQIFNTINSLGVTLTTAQLLKNYLFSRDGEKDCAIYWEPLFESDNDSRSWWDIEIPTGSTKRTNIDLFFDSLLQILIQDPLYNVSAEDKNAYARVDQLYHSYQDFLTRYYGREVPNQDYLPFLKEMNLYAELFRNTFDPSVIDEAITADDQLKRINLVIFGLKNTTLIPYVLFIMKNVEDANQRTEMLKILESYIMRRIVTRESSKSYKRLFNSFIAKGITTPEDLRAALQTESDTTTKFPTDDEITEAFESETKLTNLYSKGILYLLETRIRPKNSGTDILGFNAYSLEHLMPKKWRNKWEGPKDEDQKKERDRKLLTLGNLAIITPALNASVRDAAWETKCDGKDTGNPGLRSCSSGLATFEGVLDKDSWNETEIANRGKWLAEQAITAWPSPEKIS